MADRETPPEVLDEAIGQGVDAFRSSPAYFNSRRVRQAVEAAAPPIAEHHYKAGWEAGVAEARARINADKETIRREYPDAPRTGGMLMGLQAALDHLAALDSLGKDGEDRG